MTQCEQILEYLNKNGKITTMDAFNELGCTRLASRIFDLKQAGYEIQKRTKSSKINGVLKTYTEYYVDFNSKS